MAISDTDVIRHMTELREAHSTRRKQQGVFRTLSRNLDPRETSGSIKENYDMGMDSRRKSLRSNNARTYLDLGIHMLSGRQPQWNLPLVLQTGEEEARRYGRAERYVQSMFRVNDQRLSRKHHNRLQRSIADTFCRYGMACVFHTKTEDRDGNVNFIFEPWDPMQVSEQVGDAGVEEVVRDFVVTRGTIERMMMADDTISWKTDKLNGWISQGKRHFRLAEWYSVDKDDNVSNAIGIAPDADGVITDFLMPPRETNMSEIPLKMGLINGEAFPGDEKKFAAQSILEPNLYQYLYENDLLAMIDAHARQALSRQVIERTRNANPRLDPGKAFGPGISQSVTTYDVLDGRIDLLPVNSFDPSIQILQQTNDGMRQRGSVPDALTGQLPFRLSGFAISQLLEAALAVVAESLIQMELLFGDLGKYVLEETELPSTGGISFVGVNPSVSARGFVREEFTVEDMPEYTDITTNIEIAKASDALERMNMAAMAMPGAQFVLPPRVVYEQLLGDFVPDAQAAVDEISWLEISRIPAVQMNTYKGELERRKIELTAAGENTDALDSGIAFFEQLVAQASAQNDGTPQGRTTPDPRNLSNETADPNANTGAGETF